jgi:hypothetical protein
VFDYVEASDVEGADDSALPEDEPVAERVPALSLAHDYAAALENA